MVGAVIVHEGKIIGEGFHRKYGESHAEVNAVNSVANKNLLKESTIYVSLEPCAHYGKTPPCAELIVKCEIPRVVICNADPHSKVDGKGVQILKRNGITVTSGVLEDEGEFVNRRFFKSHRENMPYVILKCAQNENGLLDKSRGTQETGINWITTPETKAIVHKWRAEEDAILVGANTVLNDSPKLNVRHTHGINPLRVVLDPNRKIPENHAFWSDEIPTLWLCDEDRKLNEHVQLYALTKDKSFAVQCLEILHQQKIQSIIIEGGAYTLAQFIEEKLWNEARVLHGKNGWTSGLKAPKIEGKIREERTLGKDALTLIEKL